MNRKMAMGLASAFLLAGTVSVAAMPAHGGKIQMNGKTEIPATLKPTAHVEPLSKMAMHKSWSAMSHETAWNGRATTLGDREVKALNVLEAAGYRTFMHMHPAGHDIAVQAMKGGKEYSLNVAPSGTITRRT
ncbi:MAG: hypothetical protein KGJ53_15640 [Alphaproteobacteria bacterium]|nr:hypothetical protein [Alphaproteobacteria bacterium]